MFRLQVDAFQHFADGFRANPRAESIGPVFVLGFDEFLIGQQLPRLQRRQARLNHHVVFEIQDAFQILQGHIQQQSNAAGQRFQEPNVRHRRGQFDVTHAFATDAGQGDFDPAFLAGNAPVLHALVFAAQAFVIFDRAKDPGAEQPFTFRLERAVVDGFWLFDFAERP